MIVKSLCFASPTRGEPAFMHLPELARGGPEAAAPGLTTAPTRTGLAVGRQWGDR